MAMILCAALLTLTRGLGPTQRGPPIRSLRVDRALSLNDWQEIYQRAEPVLLKGIVKGTQLMDWLSLEGLRTGPYSNYVHEVAFRRGHGSGPRNPHQEPSEGWLFREAEEWLGSQNGIRDGGPVLGGAILEEFPGEDKLMGAFLQSLPNSLWLQSYHVKPAMWINFNTTNLVTGLHIDKADNFFMAVEGTKFFQVFPFEQADHLEPDLNNVAYSKSLYHAYSLAGLSTDDLKQRFFDPDTSRFPGFAKAEGTLVELEPGDVLYLPAGTWHSGLHDGLTIGANFWSQSASPYEQALNAWLFELPDTVEQKHLTKKDNPLPQAFEELPYPKPPARGWFSRVKQFVYEGGHDTDEEEDQEPIIDWKFLDAHRRALGCYQPSVSSFAEFEKKLAGMGDQVTCMLTWFKKFWDKMDGMAKRVPKSRKQWSDRGEAMGQSLGWACAKLNQRDRKFSYTERLQKVFPGCIAPHGCGEAVRNTMSAVRSIVSWKPCHSGAEL